MIYLKQKVLIISLFLVLGFILSGLLTITSLSLTKEVKSTFSVDEKEVEYGNGLPPGSEDGRTIEYGKGGFVGISTMLNENILPFANTMPINNRLKVATYYLSFLLVLVGIIYFLRKSYKKKTKSKNDRSYKIEETKKQPTVLEKNDEIEVVPSTKEIRATTIEIHESRRLLQKWEAGLVEKKMKRETETINEWFERINGPIDIIPIYERVRYGEKSCTEEELRFIKNTLKL